MTHQTTDNQATALRRASDRCNIEFLILTKDEELNLPHTLDAILPWADRVHIVDSGSTDRTLEIANDYAARYPGKIDLVHQPWLGYAAQKNWALDSLDFQSDWIFIVDADEIILPELRDELLTIARQDPDRIPEDGFFVNRYFIFLGKRIRHCGYYPSWNLRFFKKGRAHYEDREVHEHMVLHGREGWLRGHMEHNDRRGLEAYMAKHNRYSTLEALEIHDIIRGHDAYSGDVPQSLQPHLFGNAVQRRRWVKRHIYPRLPAKWLFRFLWMYIIRLGILDGITGFRFCLFISAYELLIDLKISELLLADRGIGSAPPESSKPPVTGYAPAKPERARAHFTSTVGAAGNPTSSPVPRSVGRGKEDDVGAAKTKSPWTVKQNIGRVLWAAVEKTLFRWSFHNWYGWRNFLLRIFGAQVHPTARLRRSVHIEIPWNLTLHDYAGVGDGAILYCLGPVTVGTHATISQYTHICAGTHDFGQPTFPLLRPPIVIGAHAWIAADAFVGPGVTVGEGAILGARGCAFKDLKPWTIYGGNPAKPLRPRERFDAESEAESDNQPAEPAPIRDEAPVQHAPEATGQQTAP
ncbi:MAG: glycosyltransferase [Phycisphaerales bacterium]